MSIEQAATPQRVSIAMATYNGAKNLPAQLESLAKQTLVPFELVVTDDGSTDDTLEVLRSFGAGAGFPVRVFTNESRLGYADNFLKASTLCTGTLIAFCDQDDVWDPNKLAFCARTFDDPEVMLCIHQADVWDGAQVNGLKYPQIDRTEVHEPGTLDPLHLVPGFVMVLRPQLLHLAPNDARPRNLFTVGKAASPMAHDQWIWFLATVTSKVATLSDTLALYRQHGANVVGAPKKTGKLYGLLLSLSEARYSELGELEADCARVTLGLGEGLNEGQRVGAEEAGRALEKRSRYHLLRSTIYEQRRWFGARLAAFFRIAAEGGYRDSGGKYTLGRRAMLKDLCLGVTAIYRITSRKAA